MHSILFHNVVTVSRLHISLSTFKKKFIYTSSNFSKRYTVKLADCHLKIQQAYHHLTLRPIRLTNPDMSNILFVSVSTPCTATLHICHCTPSQNTILLRHL